MRQASCECFHCIDLHLLQPIDRRTASLEALLLSNNGSGATAKLCSRSTPKDSYAARDELLRLSSTRRPPCLHTKHSFCMPPRVCGCSAQARKQSASKIMLGRAVFAKRLSPISALTSAHLTVFLDFPFSRPQPILVDGQHIGHFLSWYRSLSDLVSHGRAPSPSPACDTLLSKSLSLTLTASRHFDYHICFQAPTLSQRPAVHYLSTINTPLSLDLSSTG